MTLLSEVPQPLLHSDLRVWADRLTELLRRFDTEEDAEAERLRLALEVLTTGVASKVAGRGLFRVYRGGSNQTTMTAAAFNKVQFNTELADDRGWFDAATNFRFQPNEAGWYAFLMHIRVGQPTAVDAGQAALYKNGALEVQGTYVAGPTTHASYSAVAGLVQLNGTTDFVEGWAYLPVGVTSLNMGLHLQTLMGCRIT